MSSRKVISFLIIATAVLLFSAGLTTALILTAKHATVPETITAYAFKFGETNSAQVREVSSSKLTLKSGVKFKPCKGVAWNDGYVHYSGQTIADGVEFGTTSHSAYVCVIPFEVKNSEAITKTFYLNVQVSSASEYMKNSVVSKIYIFETGEYVEAEDFESYATIGTGESKEFCLVAISDISQSANVNYGVDFANINLEITKS